MRILKFFQLRLDFETFVITGPSTGESTEAANAGKGLFGKPKYIDNLNIDEEKRVINRAKIVCPR